MITRKLELFRLFYCRVSQTFGVVYHVRKLKFRKKCKCGSFKKYSLLLAKVTKYSVDLSKLIRYQ